MNNTVGEELETKADLTQLGSELRSEMAELRADINELRAEVRGEFKLYRWMFGVIMIAVVIPLIRDFML